MNNIDNESIDKLIRRGKFYFIKNFYKGDLLNAEYKRYITEEIQIRTPKYMRSSERKINGKIIWYIIDTDDGKVIKKFSSFSKELIDLSPSEAWGIEYIKLRWQENFTLEKWNDFLENKWYMNYLRLYEPEKLCFQNKKFLELPKPTSFWNIENKEIIKKLIHS